ncbi:MAG: T9SS type A sorting domain-containing protein [Bacteroidota bacterium]
MKKNLLTILSVIAISSIAIAQPTLTPANTNPVTGDVLTLQSYSYIAPGSAGANQTWNFSAITQSTNAATAYSYAAVSASNTSTFPNANQQFSSATTAGFNKTSATALQNYGVQQGTVNIVYSNPEDQMRYPFTMGDSYSDAFKATFTSAGSNFVRKGTTTVTADAYGTLQLPSGTFSNVLRAHFVQNYQDSSFIVGLGAYVITYLNDQYMWYLPNNHMPIFSSYSITVTAPFSAPSTSTGSNKLVTITTGINEQTSSVKSLNFYPNPVSSGILNLDLNLNETIKYQVVIMDNLGREVLRSGAETGFSGYNFNTFDVSKIASGLYNFSIISDNKSLVTKKIIIAN